MNYLIQFYFKVNSLSVFYYLKAIGLLKYVGNNPKASFDEA